MFYSEIGFSQGTDTFVSGGLGLTKANWEESHVQTELDVFTIGTGYDEKFDVVYLDDVIWLIYQYFDSDVGTTLEIIETQTKSLIPADSIFVQQYLPEGMPEVIVDIYHSKSQSNQYSGEEAKSVDLWNSELSGTFTVQYLKFDDGYIGDLIIGLGNNP